MLRVHKLLHDAPDLMNGLWEFLGSDPVPIEELEASADPKGGKPEQEPQSLPQKRKRKDKEMERDGSGKGSSGKVRSCCRTRHVGLIFVAEAQKQT
jgi:hypothetical protein